MHSRYLCGLEPAVTKDLCQFRIPFALAWALSLVLLLVMQTSDAAVDSVIASAASSSSSSSGFAAAHLLQTQK
jgi:hypothetical protein